MVCKRKHIRNCLIDLLLSTIWIGFDGVCYDGTTVLYGLVPWLMLPFEKEKLQFWLFESMDSILNDPEKCFFFCKLHFFYLFVTL